MQSHFIYIIARANEHHQQMHSYYKLIEEELEEITKEWSVDLLIPADPAKLCNVDSPKAVHNTPGPRNTKKNEEAQDVHSTSAETPSISPERGVDGGEIDGT
jgi:hypothetical protein